MFVSMDQLKEFNFLNFKKKIKEKLQAGNKRVHCSIADLSCNWYNWGS